METSAASILRELRAARGTTLREAADALGVDVSHLSRVERGEKRASEELRRRAEHYYNVDLDALALAAGRVPEDVLRILRRHPEVLNRLRSDYGDDTT